MAIADIILATQEEKKLANNYTSLLRARNTIRMNAKNIQRAIELIEKCSNYLANVSEEEKAEIAKDKLMVQTILD